MSETTPPVPKSGGSGPFILAAIVMLLLMGGLIYWKTKGSGTDTAKVEAPKPSATVEQQGLDEPPPPPPPPIASTDASAAPDTSKPTKKLGGCGRRRLWSAVHGRRNAVDRLGSARQGWSGQELL